MDQQMLTIRSAMIRRGFAFAALHFHERWAGYRPAYRQIVYNAWKESTR